MENVMLNIEVQENLREDFKVFCIRNKTTMRDVIIKHINKLLKKEKETKNNKQNVTFVE